MSSPPNAWYPLALLLGGIALGAWGGLLVVWSRYRRSTRVLGAFAFLAGSGLVGVALLRVIGNAFLTGFLGALYCLAVLAALLSFDSVAPPEPSEPTRRRFSSDRTTRVVPRGGPPEAGA
ncbi:MAG: hypothetical protein IPK07_35810 [Deltaproteobacteria bacterium]|nr:hypothetical protein [Deltaproteobacteria bacterium]